MDRRKLLAGMTASAVLLTGGRATGKVPDRVEALRSKLRGALFLPDDPGYPAARRGGGSTPVYDRHPALVVQAAAPDDVARALEFARSQGLDVAVRAGGHDLLGASTPTRGLLLDLSRMNAICVDPRTGIARVGAGVRAGALTAAVAPHGLAPMVGMNPNVGIGGLTLGGGMGWLAGSRGATVDHLVEAELVTADGRLLKANARDHADLFWALRGGGGNFGVATSFTYRLQPLGPVLAGDIGFRAAPVKALGFLRDMLAESPDELEIATLFTLDGSKGVMVRLCWSGAPEEGERVLRPLRAFAPIFLDTVKSQPYASFATAGLHFDNMFLRAGEFAGLTDPVIDAFAGIIDRGAPKGCMIGLLHYIHGALCRVPEDSTPFLRQPGHLLYNIVAPWQGEQRQQDKEEWALGASEALRAMNSRHIYINYLSYQGGDYVRDSFGPHYPRLRAIKRRYDPDNVFHNNRNIGA